MKPLSTAAALFWFEVVGGLATVATTFAFVVPHGSSAQVMSMVATMITALLAVLAYAGVAWLIGFRSPRLRAALLVALGLAGIAVIAAAWTADVVLGLLATLWLGFPSAAMVIEWGRWLVDLGRTR